MAITPKIVPNLYPSPNARLSLDEKVEVILRYMKENDWKWIDKIPSKEEVIEVIEQLRRFQPVTGVSYYGGFEVSSKYFRFLKHIVNGKSVSHDEAEVLLEFNEYVTSKD